jgi:uncharacterized OB-fold protein
MTEVPAYTKPLPRFTPLNRPFWDAARRRELHLQHCKACQRPWYPIGPRCPRCLSDEYEWHPVSGNGSVLSYVVFHQVYDAAFKGDVPYNVAIVDLAEDVRMFTNIVGIPNEAIEVGMDVHVTFDDVTPEVTIPRFRPLANAAKR